MFAFVGNGYAAIVRTKRELDRLCLLYQYPKFKKCSTEESAREWLRRNSRSICTTNLQRYGDTSYRGYVDIEYFIDDNFVAYNLDISKVGFVKIRCDDKNVVFTSTNDYIKVKVCKLSLDASLITSHLIAILRALRMVGDFIDVNINVPDMSVVLACTKYIGNNYVIKKLYKDLHTRKGGVSFTLRRN